MKNIASPLTFGLAVYLGALVILWLNEPGIAAENGLMENLQAGFLGVCFFLTLLGARTNKRFENRFPFSVSALLFLAAFLREVDVERFNLPELLILLGSGTGRTVLIALPALVLLFWGVKMRAFLRPLLNGLLRSPVFGMFLIAILLYGSGGFFDHHLFRLPRVLDLFLEEFCENAATFCLLAGCLTARRTGFYPFAMSAHFPGDSTGESVFANNPARR